MTLREMCEQAAVYTDRRDDFVTITGADGKPVYDPEDDPGIWYQAMKMSINTAYREAARRLMLPDMRAETELGENGTIDLLYMSPGVSQVKAIYNADATAALPFDFETKFRIKVRGGKEGDDVIIQYCYVPDALESFTDEPEFPESLVDPMLYISLACADLWRSERKLEVAQVWENRYYSILGGIRTDLKSPSLRRIRRSPFR